MICGKKDVCYNSERKWWGTKEELECAYKLLEDYVRNNWEKY